MMTMMFIILVVLALRCESGIKKRTFHLRTTWQTVKTVARARPSQTLSSSFDTEVRPLIDLIDKLRGFGLDRDISLPAVAVIGDQSAGKSSVLEAISGVQLPRGTGIVTRCPLEMRMKHVEGADVWEGRIVYMDRVGQEHTERVLNPESVGTFVKQAQKDMTDSEKGISDELITLEITSSKVPDLTLIDLPGIARNAVEGQPFDIETRIKALIRKYIQRQETIILAVLQCNVDIATCEALKMAKEFDSEGGRTLGVLTKPDLLDKGAEAGVMKILNNAEFQLSKGYMVVRCRGQHAIDQGQTLEDALQVEEEFFQTHPHFSSLRPSQRGIANLSVKLSRELKKHIKTMLPDLREDVREKMLDTEKKLHDLGSDPPQTPSEKRQMALEMVQAFLSNVKKATQGQRCDDPEIPEKVNSFYSNCREHFGDLFTTAMSKMPDSSDKRLAKELEDIMKQSRGKEFCNYMGKFELVESLARRYVMKLKISALGCFDQVHELMTEVLKCLAHVCFCKFPDFEERAKDIIFRIRTEVQKKGREEVKRYFSMEEFIYSQDKCYGLELATREKQKESEEEELRLKQGKSLTHPPVVVVSEKDINGVNKAVLSLASYYTVACRRLCDIVPMITQLHVFKEQVGDLQKDLMDVASDETMMETIEEDPEMASQREAFKGRLERLQFAERELDKVH